MSKNEKKAGEDPAKGLPYEDPVKKKADRRNLQ